MNRPAPGAGRPKPRPQPKPKEKLPECRCIYAYEAQDTDELSFKEGDIIGIVHEGKYPWFISAVFWHCWFSNRNGIKISRNRFIWLVKTILSEIRWNSTKNIIYLNVSISNIDLHHAEEAGTQFFFETERNYWLFRQESAHRRDWFDNCPRLNWWLIDLPFRCALLLWSTWYSGPILILRPVDHVVLLSGMVGKRSLVFHKADCVLTSGKSLFSHPDCNIFCYEIPQRKTFLRTSLACSSIKNAAQLDETVSDNIVVYHCGIEGDAVVLWVGRRTSDWEVAGLTPDRTLLVQQP